jgi:recombination protein RecA
LGGDAFFNDPEARLNKSFAKIHGLNFDSLIIEEPDTVTQVFNNLLNWKPVTNAPVHGFLTDSLAALSTNMEMDNEEGDKMGMRRAKEFSEGLRKACRFIKQNNYIMVCSNQIRVNAGASAYGEQFTVPGGKAIAFYASVRLRFHKPEKIKKKIKVAGKEITKVTGILAKIEVYKNSCDEPFRTAEVYIDHVYGIDDIKTNLQYIKDYTNTTSYCLNGEVLDKSLDKAALIIESNDYEEALKEEVINLWTSIQAKFETPRKKKIR